MANVMAVTAENFEQEVLKADKPVIIDFWAEWCGPCRMFGPEFADCAEELANDAKFVKVNIDDEMSLARKFKVMSIPTVVIVKDGAPVSKNVGALSRKELADMVKAVL